MFKDKIRILREKNGLSQQEISKYLGVTQSQYSNYERGVYEPPFEILKKISKFYKVSTDYLLDNTLEKIDIEKFLENLNDLDKEQIIKLNSEWLKSLLKLI